MDSNKIKHSLEEAYNLLSSIYVNQSGVELMCAAKSHLKNAYKELSKEEKVGSDGG